MVLPGWVNGYVGLPYLDGGRSRSGIDCYGLLRILHRDLYGRELPAYSEERWVSKKDNDRIAGLASAELDAGWEAVAERDPVTQTIEYGREQEGDVVLLRMMGRPIHCGMVIVPGHMIHIEEGIDSVVESYRSLKWDRRVLGFYRARVARRDPAAA
jgi:cell wall-associated NlpC family hydrolase